MKSNRAARRLLGVHINNTYRISNRRWLVWGSNWPFVWEHAKPSRRQRKAKRVIEEIRRARLLDRIFINNDMADSVAYAMRAMIASGGGQHTQGERER